MPDKIIIEKAIKGKLSSFRELVEASIPMAYSFACRMTGNAEDASDIVQESMISVWKGLHRLNSAEGYKSWLYRIVINKCRDHFRKKKRNSEIFPDDHGWAHLERILTDIDDHSIENEENLKLITLLTDKLSPMQKTVFILCDLEGLSHEEVAGITSTGRGNIKANLYYARKKMMERIEKINQYDK